MDRNVATLLTTAWLLFFGDVVLGEDWPHWRGPSRDGTTRESSRWDEGAWPPESRWKTNASEGASSPLVVGDCVYAMGWRQGRDLVVCLDAASGKTRWETSYECGRYGRFATGDEGLYSGVTSTPEYDEESGLLFTLSTDGHLHAWDTRRDGKRAWGFNLSERFGVEMPIAREVYGVVHEGRTPMQAYRGLIRRKPGNEEEPG